MNYAFQTFGCRLNRAEALDAEAAALAAGHAVVPVGPDADVIVVRGCSVTARAQRDCEKAVDRLRREFPRARVVVAGCLPGAAADLPPGGGGGPVPLRTARAYLKVQDGCAGRCAFCIVPRFRGPPHSVPFAGAMARAAAFLAAGYRELVVTGCNLALYRSDGRGLGGLLDALAGLSSAARVRLGSLEPCVCDDAVLDAFAARPNICRFLHLSVQSGSDAVLRRMGRPYSAAALERSVERALARVPGLALGADVIAGFPGETDAEFAETRRFLARYPFPNLHVFPYSERPGTAAAEMTPVIPREVRHARARELEALGAAARLACARGFVGREAEVCVERAAAGGVPAKGWSGEYLACEVAPCATPRRGLVAVRVLGVRGGEPVLVACPACPR